MVKKPCDECGKEFKEKEKSFLWHRDEVLCKKCYYEKPVQERMNDNLERIWQELNNIYVDMPSGNLEGR